MATKHTRMRDSCVVRFSLQTPLDATQSADGPFCAVLPLYKHYLTLSNTNQAKSPTEGGAATLWVPKRHFQAISIVLTKDHVAALAMTARGQ